MPPEPNPPPTPEPLRVLAAQNAYGVVPRFDRA